jgi:membrane-associated phospholipid phosphatase
MSSFLRFAETARANTLVASMLVTRRQVDMTPRDSHIPTPSGDTPDSAGPRLSNSSSESPQSRGWRAARVATTVIYLVVTGFVVRKTGIPIDREIIVVWLVGLALMSILGRTKREAGVVVLSWLPFLIALYFYDRARGLGYVLHGNDGWLSVKPQIRVDRFLGGGRLWTERLQGWLLGDVDTLRSKMAGCNDGRFSRPLNNVRWYDVAVSGVYTSHFVLPYLAAGYFWRKGQRLWRWYAGTFVFVSLIACAIFAIAPTAPPWYAACEGLIDRFPRGLANDGWRKIGLDFASRAIDKGGRTFNPYAAIPSLHSANAMLVSAFAWRFVNRRLRFVAWPILVAYPLGMGFALVYSGEHYLIDIITGFGLVALLLTLGWLLRRWRDWSSPWRDGPTFAPGLVVPVAEVLRGGVVFKDRSS